MKVGDLVRSRYNRIIGLIIDYEDDGTELYLCVWSRSKRPTAADWVEIDEVEVISEI